MPYYYCFDGDKFGEGFENAIMNGSIEDVKIYVDSTNDAIIFLKNSMLLLGAEHVLSAGDSIIFTSEIKIAIEKIPIRIGNFSFSVGVGQSTFDAAVNLYIAKAGGRSRIIGEA